MCPPYSSCSKLLLRNANLPQSSCSEMTIEQNYRDQIDCLIAPASIRS